LRFQLIEGRAMAQSDIKITFEDLKTFTTKISVNKWQYGQTNPTDEEVQGIVASFVKPRRSKKLSDQVVAEKLLELFRKSKSNN
jgi:trigger factor